MTPDRRFYDGVMIGLPISLLLWAGIIFLAQEAYRLLT